MTTNEDVLSGPGLDPEILADLTDEQYDELVADTQDEMKLIDSTVSEFNSLEAFNKMFKQTFGL